MKCFHWRLLYYTQLSTSDPDYTFFPLFVIQYSKLQSQIIVAMKKACCRQVTAVMLTKNFSQAVKAFIVKDDTYHFMSTIKETAAYWERFPCDVLVMVKQLGLPTFFMILSCADLHWNELISIFARFNGEDLNNESINAMDFLERFLTTI